MFKKKYLVTPFQCRLRDCTYSAPIYVKVEYVRQKQIVKRPVQIGRIPIMLRSEKCVLYNKTHEELGNYKRYKNIIKYNNILIYIKILYKQKSILIYIYDKIL